MDVLVSTVQKTNMSGSYLKSMFVSRSEENSVTLQLGGTVEIILIQIKKNK